VGWREGPLTNQSAPHQSRLFDHLVGDSEERWRNCQPQSLCSLLIYDGFEFLQLHYWKIGCSFAFENATDIIANLAVRIDQVRPITYQTA